MTISERLNAVTPDSLGDLVEIANDAAELEAKLEAETAAKIAAEKSVSELRGQMNKLYGRLTAGAAGAADKPAEKPDWRNLKGKEALEAFFETKEEK